LLNNSVNDLIDADPAFNGSTPPQANIKPILLAKLLNYQGTGKTIKQVAAEMYSTANMYYSNCVGSFGASNITCNSINYTIPTSALDAEWVAYRDMYLAEKQIAIMDKMHQNACSSSLSNYYNGAIGDANFNPVPSFVNYGFYVFPPLNTMTSPSNLFPPTSFINVPIFWPDYANNNLGIPAPTTFNSIYHHPLGQGFFDYACPSSLYHLSRYSNKIRRVPDTQTLANSLAGGASNSNDILSNLQQQAENDIYFATGQKIGTFIKEVGGNKFDGEVIVFNGGNT